MNPPTPSRHPSRQSEFQPRWEDLRFPAQMISSVKPVYNPTYYGYELRNNQTDDLTYLVQLSHTWAHGTIIKPHVHFVLPAAATGDIKFQLSYSWANVNEVFPAPTVVTKVHTISVATPDTHLVTGLASIDGTGKNVSSILRVVLARLGSDAQDTFTGDVYAAEFDIHYQITHNGTLTEFGPD